MVAGQQRWKEGQVTPWRQVVPRLERHMAAAEAASTMVKHVRAGLELVIDIESSEINDVFSSVVAAVDSDFVQHTAGLRRGGKTTSRFCEPRIAQWIRNWRVPASCFVAPRRQPQNRTAPSDPAHGHKPHDAGRLISHQPGVDDR